MPTKAELQAEAEALGLSFNSKTSKAALENLIAGHNPASAPGKVRVFSPVSVSVSVPSYEVTVPAPKPDPETGRLPAGIFPDEDGNVVEPGPVKKFQFAAGDTLEVDADAWHSFSKNGAHLSFGITRVG